MAGPFFYALSVGHSLPAVSLPYQTVTRFAVTDNLLTDCGGHERVLSRESGKGRPACDTGMIVMIATTAPRAVCGVAAGRLRL